MQCASVVDVDLCHLAKVKCLTGLSTTESLHSSILYFSKVSHYLVQFMFKDCEEVKLLLLDGGIAT